MFKRGFDIWRHLTSVDLAVHYGQGAGTSLVGNRPPIRRDDAVGGTRRRPNSLLNDQPRDLEPEFLLGRLSRRRRRRRFVLHRPHVDPEQRQKLLHYHLGVSQRRQFRLDENQFEQVDGQEAGAKRFRFRFHPGIVGGESGRRGRGAADGILVLGGAEETGNDSDPLPGAENVGHLLVPLGQEPVKTENNNDKMEKKQGFK